MGLFGEGEGARVSPWRCTQTSAQHSVSAQESHPDYFQSWNLGVWPWGFPSCCSNVLFCNFSWDEQSRTYECLTQALTICTSSKVRYKRKFLRFKSKIRHNRWFRPSPSKTFKSIQKFPLESSQRSPFIYVRSIYITLTTCQTLHGLMDLILKTTPWVGTAIPRSF